MYILDIKLILRNLNMSRELIMVLQASTKGQSFEPKFKAKHLAELLLFLVISSVPQFSSIQLNLAQPSSTQLSSTQLSSTQLNSA